MDTQNNLVKVKRFMLILISLLLLSIIIFAVYTLSKSNTPKLVIEPNNIYDETLTVVADLDYEPYSFMDGAQVPTGYDVELIYALADEMQINVDVQLTSWNDAIDAIKSGRADLLLGLEYTPKDLPYLELSMPLHNDPFVTFGQERYSNISTLYDKKLAALENSGSYPLFLRPYQLEANTTAYTSYSDAFASVESGENDYVITRYSVGRRAAAKYNDSSIHAVGPILSSNDFCIGAAVGNTALIEELNEAIIQKRSDGTIDALSDKWLGQYVEVISVNDFLSQYKALIITIFAIIALILAAFFIYLYRARLHRAVERQQQLLDRSARDAATHLFHKNAFKDIINQIISDSPADAKHAFFMIDIDDFKHVNDTYGHDFGDVAISTFANVVKNEFCSQDIVARMGGDEFAVFMVNINNLETLRTKAEKLVLALKPTVEKDGASITLSGTIGISVYPDDGTSFDSLFPNADRALYSAKKSGKRCFRIYEDAAIQTPYELDSPRPPL